MGLIRKGILGPFSGKVGTVVGAIWKGKFVMRSLPTVSQSYVPSPSQVAQRARFGFLSEFLAIINAVLQVGFRQRENGTTYANEAFAANWADLVTGTYPTFALDYSKLVISAGSLPGFSNLTASDNGSGGCDVSWIDNSDAMGASADDKVYILLVNTTTNECIYRARAKREDGSEVLTYPVGWATQQAAVYAFLEGAVADRCSRSVYIATVTCS